jgi:hypothetical protein
MNAPNWMEQAKRLLILLGRLVTLVGQVFSLYSKFHQ